VERLGDKTGGFFAQLWLYRVSLATPFASLGCALVTYVLAGMVVDWFFWKKNDV
jgi:hypothetical protein